MYGIYGTLGALMVLICVFFVFQMNKKKRGSNHKGKLAAISDSVDEGPGTDGFL